MKLDDVLEKLAGMPAKEREEIVSMAVKATADKPFIPSPGPQMAAYFSRADVLLFGGSPGGGKTALEVGLALNEHKRALIVRRNFVDLAGVLHTLDNILGKENSAVGGNRPVYRKPEGGVIDFMGLGDDIGKLQGNPHDLICVGKETPVLMADGSYRPAGCVAKGDLVATLEGPRRVLNAFATPPKKAVRITLPSGVSQVQSASHKLLTTSGWVPHDAYALDNPSSSSAPRGCRAAHRFYVPSWLKGVIPSRLRVLLSSHPQLIGVFGQPARARGHEDSSVYDAYREPITQGSVSVRYGGIRRPVPQHLLSWAWKRALGLPARLLDDAVQILFRSAPVCGAIGAEKKLALQGSQGHCSSGCRPCDERTPESAGLSPEQADGLSSPLLLACAAPQTPIGLREGDEGITPLCTPLAPLYAHPYTGEIRRSMLPVRESSCCVSPLGEVELFDLEVEEMNHFITLGGFVNKNCVDEAAQVPENQVRLLMGWLRTDVPGQRCRMVLGSNPPLDSTGDWMIDYFAPWLDTKHPNPAQEGELRYFLPKEDGVGYRECSPDDFIELHGVKVAPQSRTFISSKFTDNPFYDAEQYAKALAGLPDEARNILMSGNFLLERTDDMFQTIPTAWVRDAQSRWTPTPPVGVPMCAIGVDIAQGGTDSTVLAIRHDGWYAPMVVAQGKDTPDGKTAAGLVISKRRNDAKVVVDIGGGWGGDCYAHLRENGVDATSYMGVKPSLRRTVDKQLKFFNTRSEAYWRFREALDPSQPGGSGIALPHDAMLVADLCAPTYEVGSNGIKVEAKEKVCDRIGRSTDRGDAVVMAWWDGVKGMNVKDGWKNHGRNRTPQVVMAHRGAKRGGR